MDFLTVLSNNAYPTPFTNNPILPLLLISLAQQRHAPRTTDTFDDEYDYIIGNYFYTFGKKYFAYEFR